MARLSYEQLLSRGNASELEKLAIADGKIRLCVDSEQLYIDYSESGSTPKRIQITDFIKGLTESQIKRLSSPLQDKFYLSSDTGVMFYYDGTNWNTISEKIKTVDFTISTDNWVENSDPSAQEYPYKQVISSTLFNDSSCPESELLAANPALVPTIGEEKQMSYIRGFALFTTAGITVYATQETTLPLTLRVTIAPEAVQIQDSNSNE